MQKINILLNDRQLATLSEVNLAEGNVGEARDATR
jgi:hypothetical protein